MFKLAGLLAVGMIVVITCVTASAQTAAAPAAAILFDKAKVDQAMTSGAVLYDGKMYRVQMGRRAEPGQVEFHAKDTDVFYIISGSATFATGGTMVGGKPIGPGEIRGTSITGGEARKLAKGDVIVIPNGVNHWWKEIQEPVVYFVVKEVTGK
jgi:glc operon protein GlcG